MSAATCDFGCGPEPDDGSHVGGPGIGLVPACPVHGWMAPLLDSSASELAALRVELQAARDRHEQSEKIVTKRGQEIDRRADAAR